MKRYLVLFLLVCNTITQGFSQTLKADIAYLNKVDPSKPVLIAAHRGDWRNAPENSRKAIEYAVNMGVNIVEIDLKMTKDSVLVLCHDKTIDRTMTGKGEPGQFTLSQLKDLSLRNGLGRATMHKIMTFEECLLLARDKVIIDVDKGFSYFPQVIELIGKYGMFDQTIVNVDDNLTLQEVQNRYGDIDERVRLMPIIDLNKPGYKEIISSYKSRKNTVFQPVFKTEDREAMRYIHDLKKQGYQVWLNSLWASLNAGHDDDTAVDLGDKDNSWGWLLKNGATIIQTDRPKELIQYVKSK